MPNITIPDIVVNAAGQAAITKWLAAESTSIQSALAADIAAGDLTLTVAVSNWQPAVGRLVGVENEVCAVTAKNGSVLTVTRGLGGTAAVTHTAGVLVRELKYQSVADGLRDQIIQFVRQRIASDSTINAAVLAEQSKRDSAIVAAVS